jgi:hypothetical protein
LDVLSGRNEELRNALSAVLTLVSISGTMVIAPDEIVVNRYLISELDSDIKFLPITRRNVNQNAARCGSNALFVSHAQTTLSLLDQAESLLRVLRQRFR